VVIGNDTTPGRESPRARPGGGGNDRRNDDGMTDILETLERWRAEGQRVAVATLVGVERSAPRDPGAALAVNERGEIAGSISGGCVESELFEEAQTAIRTGRSKFVTYGISDETAAEHGLTCGGTLHVFVEPLSW